MGTTEWEEVAGHFVTVATFERVHQENKTAHSSLDERIRALEMSIERMSEKLTHLLEQTKALAIVATPKPIKWTTFIPILLAVLLPTLGIVYQAGRYPDRTEFQFLATRVAQLEIQNATQQIIIEGQHEALRALSRGALP